jgi:hypothetical protein
VRGETSGGGGGVPLYFFSSAHLVGLEYVTL